MTDFENEQGAAVRDVYKRQGVQCLVTETAGMTPARLAHRGMAERLPELARAAVALSLIHI